MSVTYGTPEYFMGKGHSAEEAIKLASDFAADGKEAVSGGGGGVGSGDPGSEFDFEAALALQREVILEAYNITMRTNILKTMGDALLAIARNM